MASPTPAADRLDARLDARLAGARLVGAHAALALAIGLGAALLYSVALTPAPQLAWVAVDAALVAAALAVVHRLRGALGFSALGAHRLAKLCGLTAGSLAMVLLSQLVIRDANTLSLDEGQYLETLRRGELVRHGLAPFTERWLVPFLAGRWNLLPVDDALALKALNFGAFTVTGVYLSLLLVRLRVPLGLAALAPMFLFSSYLGVYGATNRLVIDAFNYAMFALLLHALVRHEHARLFGALLLLASFNSEKAIAWLPIFAVVLLLRRPGRWDRRALAEVAVATLRVGLPALSYLVAVHLYAAPSRAELSPCIDLIHRMAFTSPRPSLRGTCAAAVTQQMMWFPFGAFTVYALCGFLFAERWLRALPLLLGAVFVQALLATDTERMMAYAFIVYLPLGFVYLARATAELPPRLGRALVGALAVLAVAQHYLLPLVHQLHLALPTSHLRRAMSALELLLVFALLFLHFAVYRREPATPAPADRPHDRS
jgi:hypothetical protein